MLQITLKLPKQLKDVDDVLGKEEMWKNAATTEGVDYQGQALYSFESSRIVLGCLGCSL